MATLTYLTTTHFDFGAAQRIPSELSRARISKPLIATDSGVMAAGLVDKVTGILGEYPNPEHLFKSPLRVLTTNTGVGFSNTPN